MSTSLSVIKALIVDDSAFARKVIREILGTAEGIEVVGTARDGVEALELTLQLKPDLVICDLKMPRKDGVEYVRTQMREHPLPILIVSAACGDAAEVVDALNAGAFNVIKKPSALATNDLRAISEELLQNVRAAMESQVKIYEGARPSSAVESIRSAASTDIVVIGVSTGGPQALRRLLPRFPADFPVPVAIVLHMPIGYTSLFAEKLDEICDLAVKEAADGDLCRPGQVLIAPAGRHLTLYRNAAGSVYTRLGVHPIEKLHRPSADVLFQSAAEVYGKRVIGVVMTGMGDDGREGCAWIKAQGGRVLTEAEKSCVIYGMPRSVVEAGLSDAEVPLDDLASAIISHL